MAKPLHELDVVEFLHDETGPDGSARSGDRGTVLEVDAQGDARIVEVADENGATTAMLYGILADRVRVTWTSRRTRSAA